MPSRRNFLASASALSAMSLLRDKSQVLGAEPKGTSELVREKMKITKVDTILTGKDVYVKITTDAGIVGYGELMI